MNYTVVENIDSYDVEVRSVREEKKNSKSALIEPKKSTHKTDSKMNEKKRLLISFSLTLRLAADLYILKFGIFGQCL